MVLKFGKYKGQTIEEIAKKDEGYLRWVLTIDTNKALKNEIKGVLGVEKEEEAVEEEIKFFKRDEEIYISVPFSLKDAFKQIFKTAKWAPEHKIWKVKNNTRNYNKLLKAGYKEEEFELKSYPTMEAFIEYLQDTNPHLEEGGYNEETRKQYREEYRRFFYGK